MTKKTRELTDQQKLFLTLLGSPEHMGDFRGAMRAAGYSDTTSIQYMVDTLHEEIAEMATRLIGANAIKATYKVLGVLDGNKSLDATNTLKAAKEILDRAGIVKRTEDVNLKIPAGGLVILPAKQKLEDDVEVDNED